MCDVIGNHQLIQETLMRQLFIDQHEANNIPLDRLINHCHFYNEALFFAQLERQGNFTIPRTEIPKPLSLLSLQALVNQHRKL